MARRDADGRVVDADRRTAFTGHKWVRWTRRMKSDFLDHLASNCHIGDAAAAIGVDPASVYGLRRRDADFAAAWREALILGYEVLETLVVGHAIGGGTNRQVEGRNGPIDVDQALRLLTHHRGALHGRPARGGPQRGYAAKSETNAALRRELDKIDRARAKRESDA